MTVYYTYHCPHCHAPFSASPNELDAMTEGVNHYHHTGHQIGEIRHFDGVGEVDGELYEGHPTHAHVHTQHLDHSHGHHGHGHHGHGQHDQHGHGHGHHQEPHIF